MKKADSFRDTPWALVSVVLLVVFVALLIKALEVLPLGTAYAVWTGIGAAGSVAVGILIFLLCPSDRKNMLSFLTFRRRRGGGAVGTRSCRAVRRAPP